MTTSDTITVLCNGMLAVIALVSSITFWRFVSWKFSALNKIPGPIKEMTFRNWLLGVFMQTMRQDFMEPHQRWWKEAGEDTKLLHYSTLFGKQFVMVLDADGIKKVLTAPSREADPPYPKGFKYLDRIAGEGLISLEGQDWHRHRRIIQPAFSISFVKTALNETAPALVNSLIECWKSNPNSDIDILSHMSAITLDIIGKFAFSYEFNSMKSIQQWSRNPTRAVKLENPLIKGLQACLTPSITRMILLYLKISFMERYFLPTLHNAGVLFDQATDEVVQNAKKQSQQSGEVKSLLEFLCKESNNGVLSRRELRNEVKTFLIAGHETTATLCSWAIYSIAKHPNIQQLLYDEITKTYDFGKRPDVDSCDKMEYMDCFLKEVLRFWPPIGMTWRSASKNCTLLGEKIEAQTTLVLPTYLLHRHPKYWTDPLEFKPERWSKTAEKDPKFHNFAYFPFSAGSRNCIGQRFSVYEAKLILTMLIREFEFALSPSFEGTDIRVKCFITLRSVPWITVRAKQRRG